MIGLPPKRNPPHGVQGLATCRLGPPSNLGVGKGDLPSIVSFPLMNPIVFFLHRYLEKLVTREANRIYLVAKLFKLLLFGVRLSNTARRVR